LKLQMQMDMFYILADRSNIIHNSSAAHLILSKELICQQTA
jgi:hypothetical protein